MNPEANVAKVPLGAAERRKFPRYRYSAPLIVRPANAPDLRAMSVEISECGASAVISALLKVGDTVELEPIGGGAVSAVIRRSCGRFCAFEFLNLTKEQAGKIKEMCRMLPLYHSRTLDLWER